MDGLVGILVLVGLAVLAMPVLLVLALMSISSLKARVAALEAGLAELRFSRPAADPSATPVGQAAAADEEADGPPPSPVGRLGFLILG